MPAAGASLHGAFYFGWDEPEDVAYIKLKDSEIVIAGHNKWKKQLQSMNVEGITQLPWISPDALCPYSFFIDQIFKQGTPEWITGAASENSMNALMKSGSGLSFIRLDEALVLQQEGNITIWQGQTFSLPLKFAYMRSRENDPMVKALLENVAAIFSCE